MCRRVMEGDGKERERIETGMDGEGAKSSRTTPSFGQV